MIFSQNFCSGAVGFLLPACPAYVVARRQLVVDLIIMYGLRPHEYEGGMKKATSACPLSVIARAAPKKLGPKSPVDS